MPDDHGIPFPDALVAIGDDAPTIDQKLEMVAKLRKILDGKRIDRFFIERIHQYRTDVVEARNCLNSANDALENMQCPPYIPGVFLRWVDTKRGKQAVVQFGSQRRVLSFLPDFETARLGIGDEVLLDSETMFGQEAVSETLDWAIKLNLYRRQTALFRRGSLSPCAA